MFFHTQKKKLTVGSREAVDGGGAPTGVDHQKEYKKEEEIICSVSSQMSQAHFCHMSEIY